jgi:sucrose-phosphate synthase
MDKLGMSRSNAEEMEQRFRFSRRIAAERLAMERAYRIITSTQQERQEQYAHPLYSGAVDVTDDARFSVIPPGVNTRVFNIDEGEIDQAVERKLNAKLKNPDQPHLLVSSRIDEKKNIAGAVAAYVQSTQLNARAGLVICIRGIDDPYKEIDRLAIEEKTVLEPILEMITVADLADRVDFLNIQSQAELAATYRYFAARKSVFVLTSFYEPFGLAPIEAVACGLGCVATRNGGPSEIFADGSAILVDPTDVGDIACGLEEALDRQTELAEIGRERVLASYTWEKTAAGYLSIIEEGMARGRHKAESAPEPNAANRINNYLI